MGAAPTYDFWWRFAAVVAVEIGVLAFAAWLLERFASSGAWRRSVWHACLIAMCGLVVVEASGASRIVAAHFTPKPQSMEVVLSPLEVKPIVAMEVSALPVDEAVITEPHAPTAVFAQSWWPATLWLTGFAALSLWAILVRVFFAVASRSRCAPVQEALLERAERIASRLRVRGRFEILELAGIRAPVTFGLVRRTIGVPPNFGETFTPEQQEVMLAHELAHVAGRDTAWNLFADLVVALLWWHPVVWWVHRRSHAATEAAADEASLIVRNGPSVLAETLVALGSSLLKPQRGVLGIKGLRSGLARRVAALLAMKGDQPPSARRHRWLRLGTPLLLAAIPLASFAWNGSSRGTPKEEWQNSVAGRAYSALCAATANEDLERIPGLLGDARIFLNAGKLDHAEGLCEEVLNIDPENKEALQVIDAITQARVANQAVANNSGAKPTKMERILPRDSVGGREQFIHPQTIGSFGHVISNALMFTTEERKRQMRLIVPQTDVTNVVYSGKGKQRIRKLLDEIRLPFVMYEDVSLRQVLDRLRDEVRRRDPENKGFDFLLSAETPLPPLDPETGRLFLGTREAFRNLETKKIRIVPPLQDVTLGTTLDAICKVAEPPVYYSVEEYAVVFLPTVRQASLYTRTYRIDGNAIAARFGSTSTRGPAEARPPLEESEGAHFLDNIRAFFVEAGADLKPPKAIFFSDNRGMLMVRTTLEDHDRIQQAVKQFLWPARQVLLEVRVVEFRGSAVEIRNALGIDVTSGSVLTDPQYRLVVRALEQAAGVHVLGVQRAATLDGQQDRFELPALENLDDAVVHVVPQIGGNDSTIYLGMMLGGREAATARLRDRQTAVVPLQTVKKVYGDVSVRVFTRIAFVTATMIDAFGNRANPEEHDGDPFEGILHLR